ncbi:MAG: M20/M25/M40 family metallo-hydrolase [Holophagales bacterium]|nr:M20/M25/M40 family metallo-hydrolase [Holophagales bacterium]MXX63113.1 M20/M25/M40 family metallo-hydrolase [Holophagales bacterium]MYC08842.1 M20/M25/M40 family metallo-hydrolase [Holophagales bacterium]MYD21027.1 M20/M25/M40 family metallo-hydrolase [Holophagales bacterium]MYI33213.1 M20/M25/M40 family metallo-hydrolase [Holophagales bacterium]
MTVDAATVDAERHRAEIELVRGLVAVPSLSRHEAAASGWLADQMAARGLERCHVDGALNAVGELGDPEASRLVVLLGHIDTVPGNIPVRIEDDGSAHGILHGRGSVDAKGPLASFVAAAARLGGDWARAHDLRVIVAGATEEEAASSRGAHFLLKRLNGRDEPAPDFCIIGEPSHWHRVTLGYKGRLLIDLMARRPSSHTAGPEVGVGITAFDLWRRLEQVAERHGGQTPFERVLPSLRSIGTTSDGLYDTVRADYGLRLPVDFDVAALVDELTSWFRGAAADINGPLFSDLDSDRATGTIRCEQGHAGLELSLRGYEIGVRADRHSPLVRAFLAAIRAVGGPQVAPKFVVKTGTCDMNIVWPVWRCPIAAYGPGDSTLDHTPNEHLDLNEYLLAVDTVELALRNLAAALPVTG